MPAPSLSIIIPTRNRAPLLAKALQSLTNQTVPIDQFEVLVVDSGSTDNSKGIVVQFQAKLNNLHYFFSETPGLHAARHLGMEKAKGQILIYIDDDVYSAPAWLESIRESFADAQVVLVGGKILPEFEIAPPPWVNDLWRENAWGRFLSLYSLSDCGECRKEIDPTYVWGCNFSIRREVLSRLGGFHPDSMPEHLLKFRGDGELGTTQKIRKLKLKAIYHPGAMVYHFVSRERLTLGYLYARAYSQGISNSYADIRSSFTPRRSTRATIRSWLALPLNLFRFFSPSSRRQYRLQRIVSRGTRAGYRFHQRAVSHDPELKKWVLQETYW